MIGDLLIVNDVTMAAAMMLAAIVGVCCRRHGLGMALDGRGQRGGRGRGRGELLVAPLGKITGLE